jgi:uncharacterized protein YbjT (DUF2867 family)
MGPESHQKVLLTGASGYVGGRLLRQLEKAGYPLRCLARHPDYLKFRVGPTTEVVAGDALDEASLLRGLEGIHSAYYLIHSMGAKEDFFTLEQQAAANFALAARECGVKRIIYLGGLGTGGTDLSRHLRSRQAVGEVLRSRGVQVLEFRASIVIGSGSLSFEMVRALVERLPLMITPRWVSVRAQPIAITDLLDYLLAALDYQDGGSQVFEIGGTDRVSYGELMQEYARQRGLRRVMIPVPVLSPRLSSLWLGLVTPLYARVGRKLVESLRHETIVHDDLALRTFPTRPRGVGEAIAKALEHEDQECAVTRWSDAISSSGPSPSWGGVRFGNRLVDVRTEVVATTPEQAFGPIQRIGGRTGYYYADALWRLRGFIDLLVGGVGVRRGRRDPVQVYVGDTIDWWRVEALEPNRRLRLAAEMKLPGRAWLEFEVAPHEGGTLIRQVATFDPVGLLGLVYWYGIYPVHSLVFRGMLRGIAQRAKQDPVSS